VRGASDLRQPQVRHHHPRGSQGIFIGNDKIKRASPKFLDTAIMNRRRSGALARDIADPGCLTVDATPA
jgi:hypothetical protein